eukprot:g19350.t1
MSYECRHHRYATLSITPSLRYAIAPICSNVALVVLVFHLEGRRPYDIKISIPLTTTLLWGYVSRLASTFYKQVRTSQSDLLWSLRRKYEAIKDALETRFPNGQVEIVGESTSARTGYLEVLVGEKLIHSKAGGDGYVDSHDKMEKISDAVKAAISNKAT